jgi:hypothetical protein
MILTGENLSTQRKTYPSATLSTTNPTRNEPGSNPSLSPETSVINRLFPPSCLFFLIHFIPLRPSLLLHVTYVPHNCRYTTNATQISMPSSWIRTHNPSKLEAADRRLRPRGHWDRPPEPWHDRAFYLQSHHCISYEVSVRGFGCVCVCVCVCARARVRACVCARVHDYGADYTF